jgi:Tfp pilus assembly protein PilV
MLVQVWKNFLIAMLIVMCGLLALICYQLAHQNQSDHAKEFFHAQQAQIEELRRQLADERTRQAERRDVDPPSEQSLKDPCTRLRWSNCRSYSKRNPKQLMSEEQMTRRRQVFAIEIEFKPYSISRASMAFI